MQILVNCFRSVASTRAVKLPLPTIADIAPLADRLLNVWMQAITYMRVPAELRRTELCARFQSAVYYDVVKKI